MNTEKISLFWFRRDLRISDNHGLYKALSSGEKILPIFIFDQNILKKLPRNDARVSFIYTQIHGLKKTFQDYGSDFLVLYSTPEKTIPEIIKKYSVQNIYANHDYEPYSITRDQKIKDIIEAQGGKFLTYKDQVIFEKNEVIKKDGTPYTVFTPYSKTWKTRLHESGIQPYESQNFLKNLFPIPENFTLPTLKAIGFQKNTLEIPSPEYTLNIIREYSKNRDFPARSGTSRLGIHLRFGTISIREIVTIALTHSETFLNELIWREFYMQILWHFPYVEKENFKKKYNAIQWKNNKNNFEKWKTGTTGYPLVDAGMRELNQTGYMHNRVRMVAASFLCKHLLIDWKWGDRYFAEKLLDFELASNNGGWQWSSGTGCDAAPYFRVFNPESQQQKFDPDFTYIKKWVPEFGTAHYPLPMVEHKSARLQAIEYYKRALNPNNKAIAY